jgi:hypothetical protein
MGKNVVELVGFFLVAAGLIGTVVAAALVAPALAVGVASFEAIFAGAATVYLANLPAKGDPR